MRYGQGSQDVGWQGPGADARFDVRSLVAADDPSPVIEELGITPVASVGRPIDRRLGLVVGLIAAVVGFGFMTRDVHPPTVRGDDDISVLAPSTAEPPTTDITAGPTALLAGSGFSVGTTIAIDVVEDVGGASWLTVDASGLSTTAVLDVEARTASGDLVACGTVVVIGDDERPASGGGARVGVGSVVARILIRRHQSQGPLGVTIRARDSRDASGWPMSGPPGCRTGAR